MIIVCFIKNLPMVVFAVFEFFERLRLDGLRRRKPEYDTAIHLVLEHLAYYSLNRMTPHKCLAAAGWDFYAHERHLTKRLCLIGLFGLSHERIFEPCLA